MYKIDRLLFHITSNSEIRRVTGIMLGRCNHITPNEPDFGMNEEEVARYWCLRSGIPWLGRADIGHDVNNKIVPFGSTVKPGASPNYSGSPFIGLGGTKNINISSIDQSMLINPVRREFEDRFCRTDRTTPCDPAARQL